MLRKRRVVKRTRARKRATRSEAEVRHYVAMPLEKRGQAGTSFALSGSINIDDKL
jgi:hypothetical protein